MLYLLIYILCYTIKIKLRPFRDELRRDTEAALGYLFLAVYVDSAESYVDSAADDDGSETKPNKISI